jgi:hypothetical protein
MQLQQTLLFCAQNNPEDEFFGTSKSQVSLEEEKQMPLMQPLPKKKPTYQVLEDEDELDFVEPALVEANGPLEMSLSP